MTENTLETSIIPQTSILVILEALGAFCSSYRISSILVILDLLRGIFVILEVYIYFGRFGGFKVFLVIL